MLDSTRQFEVVIRPRNRSPADEYYHNGAVWIEGREGNNYTIDIRNNTGDTVLFIVSVDGLDVITGHPAGPQSRGYIVNPGITINIPGWRLNNQMAAEFFFSRSQDSYVNSIGGNTSNTGVIGAMVFREKKPASPFDIVRFHSGGSYVRAQPSSMPNQNNNISMTGSITQDVSTGFGPQVTWQTQSMPFQHANPHYPDAVLAIYYNTARNLEKMGISLRKKRNVSHQANPFPGYTSTGCKPPPGWSG
jgi:hypothetical protein